MHLDTAEMFFVIMLQTLGNISLEAAGCCSEKGKMKMMLLS
jgi:hypothetical protein